jgi:GNAT superfamily N-acetyltransferase
MLEVATLLDIPRIVDLGQQLHDTSDYRDIPFNRAKVGYLMASLIQGAGVVFVHRRDGEIVGGIAGAVAEHWFSDELHGFEFSFFLEPSARHGITALRLVRAFENWCRLRGAKSIRMGITTGINQEGTAGFYRHIGFKDAGVLFQLEI